MKVLFDHQIFTAQQYGGISRYFYELMLRFDGAAEKVDSSLLLSNNAYIQSDPAFAARPFFPGKNFRGKQKILNSVNTFHSITKLKRNDFQIFHPTYYDSYFLKYLKNKPFVVTFLDMIHEKFQDRYEALRMEGKLFEDKRLLLDNAARVIAISESTKQDIMDIYGVDGSNIDVVYLGSSLNAAVDTGARLHESPYLLYVGTRSIYKNFKLYLESVAAILKQEQLSLVCAGGGAFNAEETEFIKALGLEQLVKCYAIDDRILANLYANAEAFVFPSLYEGFGIPVLEAFSTNCPCLLSDAGSLKEVGGDAALYFDATDPESMRNNLQSFLSGGTLRTQLIEKGKARLQLFSWDKTYQETIKVYNSIL